MGDDDGGFPFGFSGDDDTGDATASISATAAGTNELLHLDASIPTAVVHRCAYGFCRRQFDEERSLQRHIASMGHFVCMECARPRGVTANAAAAAVAAGSDDIRLVATRAFQSQRLLDLHLASMHKIGTPAAIAAASSRSGGNNGWSLNDLCDDLLLRMLSYLDLEPLSVAEAVCSHWRMTVASPSGQELWQYLASWMTQVLDAGTGRNNKAKPVFAKTSDSKRGGGGGGDGDDDTKGEEKGGATANAANNKGGKGKGKGGKNKGGGDASSSSGGARSRTGAVATNDTKRPPKWKIIVSQKYSVFASVIWTTTHSALAAHIDAAHNIGKWPDSLTRHVLFDITCLRRRYCAGFTPLHWMVYLDAPATAMMAVLQATPSARRVTNIASSMPEGVSWHRGTYIGMTVFQMAVWFNRLDLLRVLIAHGECDVNGIVRGISPRGYNVISLAVARSLDFDPIPLIRLLIDAGVNLSPRYQNSFDYYQPLSPLELACLVRGTDNGYRPPIMAQEGTSDRDVGWSWNDTDPVLGYAADALSDVRKHGARATGHREAKEAAMFRHDHGHRALVSTEERFELSGQRAWSLELIEFLLQHGAEDTRWQHSQQHYSGRIESVTWHLHPLYLSCRGEHKVRPELVQFWLDRLIKGGAHIPTLPAPFRSLPCTLLANEQWKVPPPQQLSSPTHSD